MSSNNSKSSDSSLVTVDASGKISLPSECSNFIDALNPLGGLAKIISELIACRIEIKRLSNQALEIKNEYQDRRSCRVRSLMWFLLLQRSILGNAPCRLQLWV